MEGGRVVGVKGIDNDDTFARAWAEQTFNQFIPPSKTPGVPPVIDVETALKIMRFTVHNIEPILANLSGEERDAVRGRFLDVQRQIGERVRAGKIASSKDRAELGTELTQLAALANAGPAADLQVSRWGAETSGEHQIQNSYLGQFRDNQVKRGTYDI